MQHDWHLLAIIQPANRTAMTLMHGFWQHLTLERLPIFEWSRASYFHHAIGLVNSWRRESWLLKWADWISLGFILLVLGLAPFVPNALTGLLLIGCGAFWLLLTVSDDAGYSMTPIHLVVLLYWGVATVATALSPVRGDAFEGWIKLTLYLLLFALMARIFRSTRARLWGVTIYLYAALIVSIGGVRQWFFGASALATWVDPDSSLAGTTRVYSYLGNPNLLAGYLIPAAVLSVAAFFAWRHWAAKALAVVMFVVNSACLMLTFSRGGWIGYVTAGFVFLLLIIHWWHMLLPKFWRVWIIPILLGGTAFLLVVAVQLVEPLQERVMSIFAGREDSSNNFRLNVWGAVLQMIADRPILGIGPGNDAFNRIYPFYQQPGYTALSAYSIFLEIAVETGIIGVTCFLWLLLVTLNQGWKQLQRLRSLRNADGFWLMAAIATMIGMLAHGMVDTVWYRPQISTLWWFVVALIASYYPDTETTSANQISDKS
jgi:putative inorganic carbon (HCO3(-)) transporter